MAKFLHVMSSLALYGFVSKNGLLGLFYRRATRDVNRKYFPANGGGFMERQKERVSGVGRGLRDSEERLQYVLNKKRSKFLNKNTLALTKLSFYFLFLRLIL